MCSNDKYRDLADDDSKTWIEEGRTRDESYIGDKFDGTVEPSGQVTICFMSSFIFRRHGCNKKPIEGDGNMNMTLCGRGKNVSKFNLLSENEKF